jgi:hypothetical protein
MADKVGQPDPTFARGRMKSRRQTPNQFGCVVGGHGHVHFGVVYGKAPRHLHAEQDVLENRV